MNRLVILAYSFKDLHRVRRLRDALWQHGLTVWPDKTLTPGSPSWQAEVVERLAEAVCVVVALSRDAAKSNWLRQVVDYARENGIPVLPVVVNHEPGHPLLLELEGEDWFDLRWSKNYDREVRALVAHIQQLSQAAWDRLVIEVN